MSQMEISFKHSSKSGLGRTFHWILVYSTICGDFFFHWFIFSYIFYFYVCYLVHITSGTNISEYRCLIQVWVKSSINIFSS